MVCVPKAYSLLTMHHRSPAGIVLPKNSPDANPETPATARWSLELEMKPEQGGRKRDWQVSYACAAPLEYSFLRAQVTP